MTEIFHCENCRKRFYEQEELVDHEKDCKVTRTGKQSKETHLSKIHRGFKDRQFTDRNKWKK